MDVNKGKKGGNAYETQRNPNRKEDCDGVEMEPKRPQKKGEMRWYNGNENRDKHGSLLLSNIVFLFFYSKLSRFNLYAT